MFITDTQIMSLLYLGLALLEAMFRAGKGRSKHHDKHSPEGIAPYIYVHTTLKLYKAKWKAFCFYLESQGIRIRSLEKAVLYVPQYLEWLSQQPGCWDRPLSAWTIRTYFAAIAKVLKLSARDYDLPTRHRADILRSRGHQPDEVQKSPTAQALADFCCCTGLRKGKELSRLRGTDLVCREDGTFQIHVRQGKGGRERYCRIIGTPEEVAAVVERMQAAGDQFVWPKIPSGVDVHFCRNRYSHRAYDLVARDVSTLPREECYFCRCDRKGDVFDRQALRFVSQQLGHNRISVVPEHYLY